MKTARLLALSWSVLALLGCAAGEDQVKIETEEEKTLYALGLAIANSEPLRGRFSAKEAAAVKAGFGDALLTGNLLVEMEVYGPKVRAFMQQHQPPATDQTQKSRKGVEKRPAKLETEEEKTLYALGVVVTSNTLIAFKGDFSEAEVAVIEKGFGDGLIQAPPQVEMEVYGPKLNEYLQQRLGQATARQAERERTKGRAFLEQAAAEVGAVRTESGLVYRELRLGTGPSPKLTDKVRVHYQGSLIDGRVFDSSVQRGEPAVFPLSDVIRGWQEGVQRMRVGGKARLVIPPELAYGDQQVGSIPPGSTLVFEVELLGIE